jgi:hypothetical protein
MRFRTLLICTLALSLPLFAQTTKITDGKAAEKKTQAAPENPAAQQPKPSAEIKKYARTFVGKWTVTGKILDEHWAPGGAEGKGFEVIRRGPGGFSVINDSRMDFGKMGPFAGHAVMYFDPAKKGYTGIWCDTWAPTCESPGLGTWDGDKLVFNGEMQMGPQKIPMRQTYSNITKTGYDWLLEAGDGKGGWTPEMKLRYDRFTRGAANTTSTPDEQKPDAAPPKQ